MPSPEDIAWHGGAATGREATDAPARLGAWSGGSGAAGSRVQGAAAPALGPDGRWPRRGRGNPRTEVGPESPEARQTNVLPGGAERQYPLSARTLKSRVGPTPGLLSPSRARAQPIGG